MRIPEKVMLMADDIRTMRVRGAVKIGRYAAEALINAAQLYNPQEHGDFVKYINEVSRILLGTRPTAVTLPNSVRFILKKLYDAMKKSHDVEYLRNAVIMAGNTFISRSYEAVKLISEFGSRLIEDGYTIYTHCNSSVVTSILVTAHKMGKNIKVYVNETRPKYQGYITALELSREGIDVTLVIDAAAGYFLRNTDLVLVGADAISSHGALVNKIGTSQLALLARTMNIPFYSAAETYKFSPNTMIGEMIEIEERDYTEVVDKDFIEKYKINVRNPAFDVTPPQYISAIITEKGIIPPIGVALILVEEYGWTLGEEFPSKIIEEN